MSTESAESRDSEVRVLSQLMSAQNYFHDFASIRTLTDFAARALKDIPGVAKCTITLTGLSTYSRHAFESDEELDRAMKIHALAHPLTSSPSPGHGPVIILRLMTVVSFWGFVLLTVEDEPSFERFRPAANNFANTVAIHLEYNRQRKSVANNQVLLEEAISDRTAELRAEVAGTKRIAEALESQRQRLQNIIEGTRVGTWEWNVQTGETIFNPHWARMIGYSLEELSPINIKTWERLTHPDDFKKAGELLERNFTGELTYYDCELRMRHKDGRWIWVHDRGKIVSRTATGGPLMMFGTHTDIDERKESEEAIRVLLTQKDLVLKEVHHRIKNNMNTVKSLIALQASTMKDPSARAALKDAEGRVRSMMQLYNKLYRSNSFSEVSVDEYLSTLVDEIVGVFPNRESVTVHKRLENFQIDVKRSSSLGMIFNELVTNAMKHAFEGREHGTIFIAAALNDGRVNIVVRDDGIGMPKSVDPAASATFGLQLVEMLTQQLDGKIRAENEGGTVWTLEFKA